MNSELYSKTLINLLREKKILNKSVERIKELKISFDSNAQIYDYLSSFLVLDEKKINFLDNCLDSVEFTNSDKNLFISFFRVLLDDKKMFQLKEIFKEILNMFSKENSIEYGLIWTTNLVEKKIIAQIEKSLERKYNKKFYLENKVNKELISGIKLEWKDNIWDFTIKNQIENLTKEIVTEVYNKYLVG